MGCDNFKYSWNLKRRRLVRFALKLEDFLMPEHQAISMAETFSMAELKYKYIHKQPPPPPPPFRGPLLATPAMQSPIHSSHGRLYKISFLCSAPRCFREGEMSHHHTDVKPPLQREDSHRATGYTLEQKAGTIDKIYTTSMPQAEWSQLRTQIYCSCCLSIN